MFRSEHGLLLERILRTHPGRWIYCWNGEGGEESFDCGCVLMVDTAPHTDCGCPCHARIEAMANAPHMKLFLIMAGKEGLIDAYEDSRVGHFHNTNGQWVNHAKAVCSSCLPEPHRNAIYDTRTGKEKPSVGRLDGRCELWPNCDCTCLHTVHPVANHSPNCPHFPKVQEPVDGCKFHSAPEQNLGRCIP